MKSIVRTFNQNLIKEIYASHNLHQEIMEDSTREIEDFIPLVGDAMYWFVLLEDNKVAGLIRFDAVTSRLHLCHVLIFPEYRGNNSHDWGKMCIKEMIEKHNASNFICITDVEAAMKYADRVGFKYVTTYPESIKKKGEYRDQVLMEIKQWEQP